MGERLRDRRSRHPHLTRALVVEDVGRFGHVSRGSHKEEQETWRWECPRQGRWPGVWPWSGSSDPQPSEQPGWSLFHRTGKCRSYFKLWDVSTGFACFFWIKYFHVTISRGWPLIQTFVLDVNRNSRFRLQARHGSTTCSLIRWRLVPFKEHQGFLL